MNFKRLALITSALLFTLNFSFSQSVDLKTASMVAKNFLYEKTYQTTDYQAITVKNHQIISQNGSNYYYVFNFNQGWVIVSADFRTIPVLAYSTDDNIDLNEAPEYIKSWFKKYKNHIETLINLNITNSGSTNSFWNHYLSSDLQQFKQSKAIVVAPMLTSKWNQSPYYNELCPSDPQGPGGHAVAGCVAIALGQVMNYFRWPNQGTGSYSYLDSTYGQQSVNYSNSTYNWNAIPDVATSSNLELAKLIYHLGVSVDMRYGPNGSGMYNHKAGFTLRTYFKYLPQTDYLFRDSTTANWIDTLKFHLDHKIPLYYAGWESDSLIGISGHAFVCDGYQDTNYFHFNWGWGGSYDGYFFLNDLTPGSSNFNYGQEMVLSAFPDTLNYSYPVHCTGAQTLSETSGNIDDGSGPLHPYQNNTNCSWLIAPADSVTNIKIEFDRFSTESGKDLLKIYKGTNSTGQLIGTYSGTNIPATVTVTGSKAFIVFTSDTANTSDGFMFSYTSTLVSFCTGTKNLNAYSGTIEDGSGTFDYHSKQSCRWVIEPPNAVLVTAIFTKFDVDSTDWLKIFDNATGVVIAEYKGNSIPAAVTSTSGKMKLFFYTNDGNNADGWEMIYTSSMTDIQTQGNQSELFIYPNPADNQINIVFNSNDQGEALLSITDITGRQISNLKTAVKTGNNQEKIDISTLPSGIYTLKMVLGECIIYKKIIKR